MKINILKINIGDIMDRVTEIKKELKRLEKQKKYLRDCNRLLYPEKPKRYQKADTIVNINVVQINKYR